jgi:hypothetical protein
MSVAIAPRPVAVPPADQPNLNLRETAAFLRCSERHAWDQLAPRGAIPCAKVGRRVIVRRIDLERFVEANLRVPVA